MQKGPDALGPGGFVVLCAFDALVVEVAVELPAFLQQDVAKVFDVLDDARAFARADVQPDARARIDICGFGEAVHDALVPPDGWRKRGNLSKCFGNPETEVERNESAERRAADASVFWAGKSAILALDEGLYFLDQKFGITIGAATAKSWHVRGRVFADACFPVL